MRVPSTLTRHMETLHSFITRNSIFERASLNMMDARPTISCWWAFVENKLALGSLFLQSLLENLVFLPKLEIFLLIARQGLRGGGLLAFLGFPRRSLGGGGLFVHI